MNPRTQRLCGKNASLGSQHLAPSDFYYFCGSELASQPEKDFEVPQFRREQRFVKGRQFSIVEALRGRRENGESFAGARLDQGRDKEPVESLGNPLALADKRA